MHYFIVFQGDTYKKEIKEGILWAPTHDKNGNNPKFHWKNLTLCQPEDIVFSVVNNYLKARATVTKSAIISSNPFVNNSWDEEGWKVEVKYSLIDNEIKVKDYINFISKYLPDRYSPFNKITGNGNQGYLYILPNKIGEFFDNLINELYLPNNNDEVFTISTQEALIMEEVQREANIEVEDFIIIEEDPPVGSNKPQTRTRHVHYSKVDYLSEAEKDQAKGILAEQLVVTYEKNYLIDNEREDLAERVKWVAKEADGYGYDVLSYDLEGNEKYIEVKATSLGKRIPFIITKNELETAEQKGDKFWIYRVYNIDSSQPKFYKIQAPFDDVLEFVPIQYKSYII